MLFRMFAMLVLFTGCAEIAPAPPVIVKHSEARRVRVIGTHQDMTLAGEQYCHSTYLLEFTSWDRTEGLVTCD